VRALARELENFDVVSLLNRHADDVQVWFGTRRGGFRAVPMSAVAAHAALEAGATVYFRLTGVPTLNRWQRHIAAALGHRREGLTCSLFAAHLGAGTQCHYDALENFTIQLQGTKTWRVAANRSVHAPLENWVAGHDLPPEMALYCPTALPSRMPRASTRVELRPGDVLYVPRGCWHSTEVSADSLSLFLGFPPTPCADFLLNALRARLIRQAAWRESVIDGGAGAYWKRRAQSQICGLLAALKADVADLTIEELLTWAGWYDHSVKARTDKPRRIERRIVRKERRHGREEEAHRRGKERRAKAHRKDRGRQGAKDRFA
jgi:hypothetical protein